MAAAGAKIRRKRNEQEAGLDADAMPTDADALSRGVGWEGVAGLLGLVVVELFLLQVFAVGVATAIYHLVPLLEVGRPQGFEDWLKLFQVVGPTLTLPGGSAIVLTIWLMARRAQQAERRAQQAERRADAAENTAASAKERLAAAQAEAQEQAAQAKATIADLQAELERQRGQD